MGGLAAAFSALSGPAQQPVERGDRTEVDAFIKQRRPHLSRGEVDEPVAMQRVENSLLLGVAQRPRLDSVSLRDRRFRY
ncbi:hypothetical protein BST27_30845 [Mycobacterium intermedium]|uniref:Uncharacterized protein n=1 Tax=Mycobacterium intermedium TaxID=28445 RepID=A0A1X0EHJ7_MYCIE|nr:hypothetical protein BST27_30845 [Mycobacterium intermedium]